jgi:hypothetical protein
MKKYTLVLLVFLTLLAKIQAQQTVGLTLYSPDIYNGYTLFAPVFSTSTYLIDNCGYMVHEWESAYKPAASAYILENGNLLRTGDMNNQSFSGSEAGGIIQMMDWNGNTIFSFDYSSNSYCLHHDIEYLPNGNILGIAWKIITPSDALDHGRDPNLIPQIGIWLEQIVEFEITSPSTADVVWEWNVEDHLIQDFDSTKANYGVVADHPEKINFNYMTGNLVNMMDWIHLNTIDYNAELDQIVVSGIMFNEIWVIDHSTTIQEAAGPKGGTYGRGGDLIYRWGNPAAYDRGTAANKILYGVHDVQWIEGDRPDAGKFLMLNNGNGRPAGDFSSIDIIDQPVDSMGFYHIVQGEAYGPTQLSWTFHQNGLPDPLYTGFMGGASQLPNGNFLACESSEGRIIEINSNKQLLWEYIVPVNHNGPIIQGTLPGGNRVFRASRFSASYPGFTEKEFNEPVPIELNPFSSLCDTSIITQINLVEEYDEIRLLSNPVGAILILDNRSGETVRIDVYNTLGTHLLSQRCLDPNISINAQRLKPGIYFIRSRGERSGVVNGFSFVKR